MTTCGLGNAFLMHRGIADALARYCHHFDNGELERLCEVFTPDADIAMGESFRGSFDEFTSWARKRFDAGNSYSHHVTNIVVESTGQGHEAASRSAVAALTQADAPDGPTRLVHGIYEDAWIECAAGWRIRRRHFVPRFAIPL